MAKIPIDLTTGSLHQQDLVVGIDLGTTNSLIAFIDADDNPQVIKTLDMEPLMPSVIHFKAEGGIVVGQEAKKYLISDPTHTIFSIKRLLGRSYQDIKHYQNFFSYKIINNDSEELLRIKIRETFYTPIELSGMLLRKLKEQAEHTLNSPITRAVITVPAYFNDSQRQATRAAGKLAGLDVLRIINEPTAASLAYGLGLNAQEEKIIAVYDLGGGTFDISILRIQNGIFEVLSTHGDTFLGGDDFDRAIVNYWITANQLRTSPFFEDPAFNQALRLKAEQAKKALSTQNLFNEQVHTIPCAIDRGTFEKLIEDKIEQTIICCRKALEDAHLKISNIDEVIMVGGATRTPLVRQKISHFFQKPLHTEINPDEVVALGAAIQGDILAGNRKDMLLLDVTPLSLGLEIMGGLMDVIIPRNSKIPSKAGRQYTTSVDGQINMKIAVYQGERELVSENRKLAEFHLKNIPPMPAGLPKVDISFLLNADGILTVSAHELRSGIQQQIEIKPSYGLTDQEIEKILLNSIEHAQEDLSLRLLIEAKTEGKQLIYAVERFLEKSKTPTLSPTELEELHKLMTSLRASLESNDRDAILNHFKALNDFTQPFAERLMDNAILQAMKGKLIE